MEEHMQKPSERIAQHKLAREVVEIVHGSEIAKETEEEHRAIFKRPSNALGEEKTRPSETSKNTRTTTPIANSDKTPSDSIALPMSLVYNQSISKVIYHAGLVASRSEGQRLITNKGVYLGTRFCVPRDTPDQIDFAPVNNRDTKASGKFILDGDRLLVRLGKWKVRVIKIISDVKFEAQGLSAPGWKEEKMEDSSVESEERMKSKISVRKVFAYERNGG